ncbi:MAG: RNA polymerase sigma factor [Deltaproteobacteria bacterium]
MHNPFGEKNTEEHCDADCIEQSLKGNPGALQTLILRHQSWIFNIALTITGDIQLAEDVTQEVLIKVLTKLSTYDPQKAAFRTWLYRIVVNHVLNMKENKKEIFFARMMQNSDDTVFLNNQPDHQKHVRADSERLREETKSQCILCVLLCLNRRERIVFTLAGIFDVTDKTGAEICEMSRANFRQSYRRSRRKVYQYFAKNCSLLNDRNPCTCASQTTRLIRAGMIHQDRLITEQNSLGTIHDLLGGSIGLVEDSYDEFMSLFREQPFLKGPDMVCWLKELIKSEPYRHLLECPQSLIS